MGNAPNYLVGHVIQKRTTLLCAQLRWAFSNYYTEFAHEQNCIADKVKVLFVEVIERSSCQNLSSTIHKYNHNKMVYEPGQEVFRSRFFSHIIEPEFRARVCDFCLDMKGRYTFSVKSQHS